MLKVLIADDEPLICSMIRKMIDWKAKNLEVAGTADNGLLVLQQIRELHPDIVITDIRMPGLDGLELIRQAMALTDQLDFIIISGYKNFEYAHQALTMGVRHYLLKPIDQAELSETLDRIIQERTRHEAVRSQEDFLAKEQEAHRKNVRQHFLNSILQGTSMETLPEGGAPTEDLHFCNSRYLAFFVKADSTEESDISSGLLDLLEAAVEKEVQSWGCEYICSHAKSGIITILNYPPGAKEAHPEDMETLFTKCRKETDKFSGYSVTIGVGTEKGNIANVRESIQEAIDAVKCRIKKGLARILFFDHLSITHRDLQSFLPPEVRNGIRRAVESMDAEAVKGDILLLTEQLRKDPRYTPPELYRLLEELIALILAVWKQNDVDSSLSVNFSLAAETAMDRSTTEPKLIQGLADAVDLYFRKILALRRQSGMAPVREARVYLSEHFRENLSLEQVADAVGMSSAYLSTLFKKEVGVGFNDYLTQLRCQEAKRLMRETRDSMAVIAQQVGYQDAKYFSRIFRKTVGIKPSEYRKLYQ